MWRRLAQSKHFASLAPWSYSFSARYSSSVRRSPPPETLEALRSLLGDRFSTSPSVLEVSAIFTVSFIEGIDFLK